MRNVAIVLATALAIVFARYDLAGADPLKAGDSLTYQYTLDNDTGEPEHAD